MALNFFKSLANIFGEWKETEYVRNDLTTWAKTEYKNDWEFAYTHTTNNNRNTLIQRKKNMINAIIAVYKNIKNIVEFHNAVKNTKRELSKLSDYELRDIGITRGEIFDIAMNTHKQPTIVTPNDIKSIRQNQNLKGWA